MEIARLAVGAVGVRDSKDAAGLRSS
ncbi:hypothetical protein [Actinomadura logoneensis]